MALIGASVVESQKQFLLREINSCISGRMKVSQYILMEAQLQIGDIELPCWGCEI